MCAALTSRHVKSLFRTYYTGFQYTPVLSIATWVTSCAASQSRSTTRSPAVVRKVCACCCVRWPLPPPIRTQARDGVLVHVESTAALDLSLHRRPPPETWPPTGGASWSRFCSALSQQQCGVPKAPTSHWIPDSPRTT